MCVLTQVPKTEPHRAPHGPGPPQGSPQGSPQVSPQGSLGNLGFFLFLMIFGVLSGFWDKYSIHLIDPFLKLIKLSPKIKKSLLFTEGKKKIMNGCLDTG